MFVVRRHMGRGPEMVVTNRAYKVDGVLEAAAIAGQVTGWLARLAWAWRTELLLMVPVGVVYGFAHPRLGALWTDITVTVLAAAVLIWPRSRRLVLGRLGCARSRRQVLATLAETRTGNSSGRLPLVMRARSTPSGQRLLLYCRTGHSAELLNARVQELRAGAHCRNVTIHRDPQRSHRVTVEVIRRDTLTGVDIASALLPVARRIVAAAAPVVRPAVELPAVPAWAAPGDVPPILALPSDPEPSAAAA